MNGVWRVGVSLLQTFTSFPTPSFVPFYLLSSFFPSCSFLLLTPHSLLIPSPHYVSPHPHSLLFRGRHQVMCDNLIRLVSNLSVGEHVSLEQLVALMVGNNTIPLAVITLLWDMFARKVHTVRICEHTDNLRSYNINLVLYTTVVLCV